MVGRLRGRNGLEDLCCMDPRAVRIALELKGYEQLYFINSEDIALTLALKGCRRWCLR